MQNSMLDHVASLASPEVLAGLAREVHAERGATARVIAWLVEVERRKLYLDAGFSSLFTYCVLCAAPHNRGYVAAAVMLRTGAPSLGMTAVASRNTT
jgi:hypothetical protein